MTRAAMTQKPTDKIINFLEYVYLCAKRNYILENIDPMLAVAGIEKDNKIIETLERDIAKDIDILTYANLIKARMVLEYNTNLTSYPHIGDNADDKTIRDMVVIDRNGNLITIHVLQNGNITVAGKLDMTTQIDNNISSEEISKYLLILGNYLKSYLQGNDQQDMYLSMLDILRTLDQYFYTYGTPRFKELTEHTAFFTSLIMESDKFFPCSAEYRKSLFVLDEIEDEYYYVYVKSIDKLCKITYNTDNKSLSFSLESLDE